MFYHVLSVHYTCFGSVTWHETWQTVIIDYDMRLVITWRYFPRSGAFGISRQQIQGTGYANTGRTRKFITQAIKHDTWVHSQ
jgi:hypothetical protein